MRARVVITWLVALGGGAIALVAIDAGLRTLVTPPVDSSTAEPALVEVLPIEDAPVAVPPESGRAYPDEVVVQQTFLGESQSSFAYGALSDAGNVCLMVHINNSDTTVQGDCATFRVFTDAGLHADLGFVAVSWYADGTVEWHG